MAPGTKKGVKALMKSFSVKKKLALPWGQSPGNTQFHRSESHLLPAVPWLHAVILFGIFPLGPRSQYLLFRPSRETQERDTSALPPP